MNKVLIIAPYSYPSACGIWKRVYDDAKALIKDGYDVTVFSSNILKGTNETLAPEAELEGIKIKRFKVWFSLGGTSMFFFFLRSFLKLNPDIVHVHGYRHPHSLMGFILSKLKGKKVLMTPHAPFLKDPRRNIVMKAFDWLYDHLIGIWEVRNYKKLILTTNWEKEFLIKLGAKDLKCEFIPNGINSLFIENKPERKNEPKTKFKFLYMGRLDPIKRLEWISEMAEKFPEHEFKIVGPLSGYREEELRIKNEKLIVDIRSYLPMDFVEEAKMADVFILPSIRESFGIVALEAMSQGLVVLFSKTKGSQEFINDGENGFLFENINELKEKIEYVTSNWKEMEKVRGNALETASKYNSEEISLKLVDAYKRI